MAVVSLAARVAAASCRSSEDSDHQRRDAGATSDSSGLSRHNRVETKRFKSFTYEELLKRDRVNLDIFWLKDEALEECASVPASLTIFGDSSSEYLCLLLNLDN